VREFSLRFASLSPYVVEELLDLTDAQKDRFEKAYDTAKLLLRDLGIFPTQQGGRVNPTEDREAFELNEFETGYPRMRLDHLVDVAQMIHDKVSKAEVGPRLSPQFRTAWADSRTKATMTQRIEAATATTSNAFRGGRCSASCTGCAALASSTSLTSRRPTTTSCSPPGGYQSSTCPTPTAQK